MQHINIIMQSHPRKCFPELTRYTQLAPRRVLLRDSLARGPGTDIGALRAQRYYYSLIEWQKCAGRQSDEAS